MSEFDRVSPVAIVGIAAIMPQAPDAATFWSNVKQGRYSVTDVPPERWDPALYFSADHDAPDKTYSKIGGFVRAYDWDPVQWKLAVPPRVADAMDETQKWAVAATRPAASPPTAMPAMPSVWLTSAISVSANPGPRWRNARSSDCAK